YRDSQTAWGRPGANITAISPRRARSRLPLQPFSDLLVGLVSGPAPEDRAEPAALSRPAPLGACLALRVFGVQPLGPAPRKHRKPTLAQRAAPPLPAVMEH